MGGVTAGKFGAAAVRGIVAELSERVGVAISAAVGASLFGSHAAFNSAGTTTQHVPLGSAETVFMGGITMPIMSESEPPGMVITWEQGARAAAGITSSTSASATATDLVRRLICA